MQRLVEQSRKSFLRNQQYWTHILCWDIQRLVKQSRHLIWEINGIGLTFYVGTCKDWLTNEDIFFEKSEALDSHTMLGYAKIGWAIRTFLLRNQRHWTHILCKGWLNNQDIPSEKSEVLDSHPMQRLVEQSGHSLREIRGIGLTFYVGTCKG